MPHRVEIHDQYTQRANLLSDYLDLTAWTAAGSGMTVAEYSGLTGAYTLTNGSLESELRPAVPGITLAQAGAFCFSFSARPGTLNNIRCRILNATLNKQICDAATGFFLPRDNLWRRYHVRGYAPTANTNIYPYFRLGRSVSGDTGTVHVFSPVIEYGDVPNAGRLPDTTAQPEQDDTVMFYLRAENNSLQTHNRRKGDLARPLVVRLQDKDGNAIDLTSNTVVFRMFKDDDDTVEVNNRSCTVNSPATDGEVSLTFQSGDVDTAGRYFGQFVRTVGEATEAIPPDKTFAIRILPAP